MYCELCEKAIIADEIIVYIINTVHFCKKYSI